LSPGCWRIPLAPNQPLPGSDGTTRADGCGQAAYWPQGVGGPARSPSGTRQAGAYRCALPDRGRRRATHDPAAAGFGNAPFLDRDGSWASRWPEPRRTRLWQFDLRGGIV